jgi:hypothetical protein
LGLSTLPDTYVSRHRSVASRAGSTDVLLTGQPAAPEVFQANLRAIGLHEERPELFTDTAERMAIRVHDLRATFTTVAQNNDRNENRVTDRCGWSSSQMLAIHATVRRARQACTWTRVARIVALKTQLASSAS